MKTRKLLFLTGTRADFGKMKSLMLAVDADSRYHCDIFVTGMHTLKHFGFTANEVRKSGLTNIYTYINQHHLEPMEMILANTISGLSRYIHESRPDMLVIHGDRVEALAGAIVGALTNTLVCHIEGGERSGTIDESIRHSVSKLSHLHLVANEDARQRLIQMGEAKGNIHLIGSPDIDVMLSGDLPSLDKVTAHYEIPFSEYGILLFHPVTTDIGNMRQHAQALVKAIIQSRKNFVVIYPNNDEGSNLILDEYEKLNTLERIRVFPSIQFESFLTLIKHCRCMVGNSSAGIRETPFYGLPSVNIGNRQNYRYFARSITNTGYDSDEIEQAILTAFHSPRFEKDSHFGKGDSTTRFVSLLEEESVWNIGTQKFFHDIPIHAPGKKESPAYV